MGLQRLKKEFYLRIREEGGYVALRIDFEGDPKVNEM